MGGPLTPCSNEDQWFTTMLQNRKHQRVPSTQSFYPSWHDVQRLLNWGYPVERLKHLLKVRQQVVETSFGHCSTPENSCLFSNRAIFVRNNSVSCVIKLWKSGNSVSDRWPAGTWTASNWRSHQQSLNKHEYFWRLIMNSCPRLSRCRRDSVAMIPTVHLDCGTKIH